jgi:hypothetical protein
MSRIVIVMLTNCRHKPMNMDIWNKSNGTKYQQNDIVNMANSYSKGSYKIIESLICPADIKL